MLEASCYGDENSFITLTYRDEDLPSDCGLSKKVAVDFIKRLRSRGHTFRYFLCGEYGSHGGRPHYHAAIFGRGVISSCFIQDVEKAWGLGFVTVYPLEERSAAYIAGYVLKKAGPLPNLADRVGPFQLMSRRPGLGLHAPVLQKAVAAYGRYLEEFPDVLPYLKYGKSVRPLGRYLTDQVRQQVMGDGYLSPRAKEYRQKKRLERLRKSLCDVYTCAGYVARSERSSIASVVNRAVHQENYQAAVNQAARGKRREKI